MHERMPYITELVRSSTKIKLITPTIILDRNDKQEAINYLQKDDEITFKSTPIDYKNSLIEIEVKQKESKDTICNYCNHHKIKDRKSYCELTRELIIFGKESCDDFKPYEFKITKEK